MNHSITFGDCLGVNCVCFQLSCYNSYWLMKDYVMWYVFCRVITKLLTSHFCYIILLLPYLLWTDNYHNYLGPGTCLNFLINRMGCTRVISGYTIMFTAANWKPENKHSHSGVQRGSFDTEYWRFGVRSAFGSNYGLVNYKFRGAKFPCFMRWLKWHLYPAQLHTCDCSLKKQVPICSLTKTMNTTWFYDY